MRGYEWRWGFVDHVVQKLKVSDEECGELGGHGESHERSRCNRYFIRISRRQNNTLKKQTNKKTEKFRKKKQKTKCNTGCVIVHTVSDSGIKVFLFHLHEKRAGQTPRNYQMSVYWGGWQWEILKRKKKFIGSGYRNSWVMWELCAWLAEQWLTGRGGVRWIIQSIMGGEGCGLEICRRLLTLVER